MRFALTGRVPQAEFDELVVDVDIVNVVFEYGGFAGGGVCIAALCSRSVSQLTILG